MKNSNYSQGRISNYELTVLGNLVDLETDVSLYRTCNLKMKATFPPKQTFSCFRQRD